MKTFARRMEKYLDKPFKADGIDENGYGCMGLIYAYAQDIGKPIPDHYGDWTLGNYYVRHQTNPRVAEQVLLSFYAEIGIYVSIRSILAGDILIISTKDGGLFPGIYCGGNKFIASYLNAGTRVFEFNKIIMPVLARRL